MASGTRGAKKRERRQQMADLGVDEVVRSAPSNVNNKRRERRHQEADSNLNVNRDRDEAVQGSSFESNRFSRLQEVDEGHQEEDGSQSELISSGSRVVQEKESEMQEDNLNSSNSRTQVNSVSEKWSDSNDLHDLVKHFVRESQGTSIQVAGALEKLATVLGGLNISQPGQVSGSVEGNTRFLPHLKSKDLQIPKYGGVHEAKTPFDFLSELEKYRLAAGLSEFQMFNSVVPLALTGQVYDWFQFIKDDVSSWGEFCAVFRKEFQPPGYDEELRRELEERTQGPHETLSHYIRIINGFYERIDPKTPESVKIARILRQMHPSYRQKVLRTGEEFVSMRQLADAALKVQEDIWYEKEYREPKQFSVVEPSLAYKVPQAQKLQSSPPWSKPVNNQNRDLQPSSFDPYRQFHSEPRGFQKFQFSSNNFSRSNQNHGFESSSRENQSLEFQRNANQFQGQAQRFPTNRPFNANWGNQSSSESITNRPRSFSMSDTVSPTNQAVQNQGNRAISSENVDGSSQRNRACFRCGREGHFARECQANQPQVSGNAINLSRI